MSPSELEALEHEVLEHLTDEEGHVEADLEEAAARASVPDEERERSPLRLAIAMAFPAVAAAVGRLASQASSSGDVLRPPVALTAGWQAILGWLLGIVGFAAAWVAIVVKKPSFGL